MKKSQASMELMLFVGIGLIILIIYFTFFFTQTTNYNLEKEKRLGQDILEKVKTEIELAEEVNNGYSRTFILPPTLNGISYNITIQNKELLIDTPNFNFIELIPEVTGNIQKNQNIIKKEENVIYLN
ncbi:MAG: hypothetical protein KJ674_03730 [Nanoarchaeota archaeon]|nr:hypothetical protein [Nanoarchaeota archaeon]